MKCFNTIIMHFSPTRLLRNVILGFEIGFNVRKFRNAFSCIKYFNLRVGIYVKEILRSQSRETGKGTFIFKYWS